MGTVRQADRALAVQLHARGVSARVVENALTLAPARRWMRDPGAPPLQPVRPLAYFLPVIEEVMAMRISPQYFKYLEGKIRQSVEARRFDSPPIADDAKRHRTAPAWTM